MANIKELIQSIEAADSSFDEKLAAINQMEETLVAMRQQEETAVQENVDLIVEAIKVMEDKVNAQLEIAKSIVPEKGDKGDKGLDGKQGKDGRDGKDGKDGINGKDGADGKDGVSVTDAKIDFDGSLVISLSTGQEINVGEVVAPELQEKIKLVTSGGAGTVLPSQTGNANKYLKTDGTALSWAAGDGTGTVTSVGTSGTVNGITLTGGPITSSGTITLGGTLGGIGNSQLTNSSITFGSTAQALGSTVSGLSGVTIDNGAVGATTPAAVTATTLIGGGGSANYGQLTGGATTKAVQFQTLGSDSNVSLAVQPKGTGAIDLAAGSSGVNISNGGTVTAITRTVAGSGYTTNPTPTISAPLTAGGTQATATCTIGVVTATVSAGGSGYVVGEILTVVGGTSTAAAVLTVATISGSAVATVTITTIGTYTASPTNPAATTSNLSGTGATFTLSFGVNSAFTITGAGSGYVEQPTITFSSGSATAYATVGSGTIIRSLGATGTQSLDFYTPQGITASVPTMRLRDIASDSYPMVNNTTGLAAFVAQGNSTASLGLAANGSGSVRLYTNGTSLTEQMRVSNTTSAVNYVQVTGATTASKVVAISAQGSDTDVTLSLSPKGAGTIRFGTHTGTILTPTGYITITDSGGTSRRLLVG
jgi:hypothetical protein